MLVHRNLSLLYAKLQAPDEAVQEAKQSVRLFGQLLASSPNLLDYRQGLAAAYNDLASLGLQHLSSSQWEEAAGVWNEFAQDELDASLFADAARFLARAAEAAGRGGDLAPAEVERRRDAYAAQAVNHLQAAKTAGWFDGAEAVQSLLDDRDFAPLRNREDFKSLLEELRRANRRKERDSPTVSAGSEEARQEEARLFEKAGLLE